MAPQADNIISFATDGWMDRSEMEECQRTLRVVTREEIIRPFYRPHSHVVVVVFKWAKIWKFIQKDVKRSGSRWKEICSSVGVASFAWKCAFTGKS